MSNFLAKVDKISFNKKGFFMSYVKNISAGENIVIEDLGDESFRIHSNNDMINLKMKLSSYFDWEYHQAKLDEGDRTYYFHVSNCIFKLNGVWQEIPDIYIHAGSGRVYDVYLRIQESDSGPSNIAEENVRIQAVYHSRPGDAKIVKPDYPYDHHIFRFKCWTGHCEVIRMQPNLMDITSVSGGFLAYHNYQGVMVRTRLGKTDDGYQGIPSYSYEKGPLLITTPISKGGNGRNVRLRYDGEESIYGE